MADCSKYQVSEQDLLAAADKSRLPQFIVDKNKRIAAVAIEEAESALKCINGKEWLNIGMDALDKNFDYLKAKLKPAVANTVGVAMDEYKGLAAGTVLAIFGAGLLVGYFIFK